MQGGCLYMQGKDYAARDVPAFGFYLINTGTPVSSTGQCVETVAPHFKSSQLSDDFGVVTNAMDAALQKGSWQEVNQAVRENHQLLNTIGVVPVKVQQFIKDVELAGGAAKTCGAGAVSGENAGAVMAMVEDVAVIQSLCSRFGYEVVPVSGENRGVHAI
jgi:mevalonate kinase